MKGPPVPIPPYTGTRFDPPHAWLFAKGIYGPPDNRPWPGREIGKPSPHGSRVTMEEAKAWGLTRD
jgi:hypothetical protein